MSARWHFHSPLHAVPISLSAQRKPKHCHTFLREARTYINVLNKSNKLISVFPAWNKQKLHGPECTSSLWRPWAALPEAYMTTALLKNSPCLWLLLCCLSVTASLVLLHLKGLQEFLPKNILFYMVSCQVYTTCVHNNSCRQQWFNKIKKSINGITLH